MVKRCFLLVVFVTVALIGPPGMTGAQGVPDRIAISGSDWEGEIEVTGAELLQHLAPAAFEDVASPVELANNLGRGYLLERGYLNNEVFQPWDRVLYFPSPGGQRGYVYYLELIDGRGPYDGHWYYVSPAGEAAFREALNQNGVRLDSFGQSDTVPTPIPSIPMVIETHVLQVDSFEACVARTKVVLPTYPAQCRTSDGRVFTDPAARLLR